MHRLVRIVVVVVVVVRGAEVILFDRICSILFCSLLLCSHDAVVLLFIAEGMKNVFFVVVFVQIKQIKKQNWCPSMMMIFNSTTSSMNAQPTLFNVRSLLLRMNQYNTSK